MRHILTTAMLLGSACTGPSADLPGDTDTDTDPPVDAPFGDLPVGEWSFVPVDGMICGDGSATGIGVHPGSSNQIAVLVAGGGACWDFNTCFLLESAVNITARWDAENLAREVAPLARHPLFDRARDDNPFAEATWIYAPYCTGDLHAGRAINSYGASPDQTVHHVGDANMQALTARLGAELPDADRAWIVGISAGGYGIQLQADRFIQTWPTADVAFLADGAPMVRPYGTRWPELRTAWDLRLPIDCDDCIDGLPAVLEYHASASPDARFGLLTFREDAVMMLYFNYPFGTLGGAIDRLIDERYDAATVNAFVRPGTDHVMLGAIDTASAPDGTALRAWIDAWADGDVAWSTAR